jgi:hypothetical protein
MPPTTSRSRRSGGREGWWPPAHPARSGRETTARRPGTPSFPTPIHAHAPDARSGSAPRHCGAHPHNHMQVTMYAARNSRNSRLFTGSCVV